MKGLPQIDLDEFPEFKKQNEKLRELSTERETLNRKRAAVEDEIAQINTRSTDDAAAEYIRTGELSEDQLKPLEERAAALRRRIEIVSEAARQQERNVAAVLGGVKRQLIERYSGEYAEIVTEWLSALCKAALAGARMNEYARHFNSLHRGMNFPFTGHSQRINLNCVSTNEQLRHIIKTAAERGHGDLKDLPEEVIAALGLGGRGVRFVTR